MSIQFDFKAVDKLYESNYFGFQALDAPEYYWKSLFGALLTYSDTESRPMGEEIAPTWTHNNVPMDFKGCNYSGTRFNHCLPMNISSLKQTVKYWDDVTAGIILIKTHYLSKRMRSLSYPVTIIDLWIVSRLCQILPAYLMRRYLNPIDSSKIPVVPAIIYRIALGLHRVSHVHLLKTMLLGNDLNFPSLSSDELYLLAEKRGLLIGSYSVCAGPKAMIIQAYQAMINSDKLNKTTLESLVDDNFLSYSFRYMRLEVEKAIFGIYAASILHDLIKQLQPYTLDDIIVKRFYKKLVKFEIIATENAPLVHEIAKEDIKMLTGNDNDIPSNIINEQFGQLRHRMLQGIDQIGNELDKQYQSYKECHESKLKELVTKQRAIFTATLRDNKLHYLFTHHLGYNCIAFRLLADGLSKYLMLESITLGIFEILQKEINECLGRPESAKLVAPNDINKALGPKLRDIVADFFKLEISNTFDSTIINIQGKEFLNSKLWV